jgi:hypothetical protein
MHNLDVLTWSQKPPAPVVEAWKISEGDLILVRDVRDGAVHPPPGEKAGVEAALSIAK